MPVSVHSKDTKIYKITFLIELASQNLNNWISPSLQIFSGSFLSFGAIFHTSSSGKYQTPPLCPPPVSFPTPICHSLSPFPTFSPTLGCSSPATPTPTWPATPTSVTLIHHRLQSQLFKWCHRWSNLRGEQLEIFNNMKCRKGLLHVQAYQLNRNRSCPHLHPSFPFSSSSQGKHLLITILILTIITTSYSQPISTVPASTLLRRRRSCQTLPRSSNIGESSLDSRRETWASRSTIARRRSATLRLSTSLSRAWEGWSLPCKSGWTRSRERSSWQQLLFNQCLFCSNMIRQFSAVQNQLLKGAQDICRYPRDVPMAVSVIVINVQCSMFTCS